MPRLLPISAFLPLPALAAETAAPGISSGTYVQATLALIFIVGLLFLATWAARKVSGGKRFGQGNMRVISGIALGPKERIVLVEVEEQWLVIGIVPGQIRTLHTLPKGVAEKASGDGQAPATPPFADWLQRIRERRDHAE
ncbi:flagellar biosynthetic protein FliO [Azonexus caeni]|uniref:flagellar biosynthetic protein FliO n=1 Tax=Azonexus caeni TaxID=266126 RepID=UPI002C6DDF02|nr:flagellar biosynthetic protein FliO [Azonexus sp.]